MFVHEGLGGFVLSFLPSVRLHNYAFALIYYVIFFLLFLLFLSLSFFSFLFFFWFILFYLFVYFLGVLILDF